jgi:hypothetical protein
LDEFAGDGVLVEVLGHPQRHQGIDQQVASY